MLRIYKTRIIKLSILLAVVLAFILWFTLAGDEENFRYKYEGLSLDVNIEGITRENTYSAYLAAHEGAHDAASDVNIDINSYKTDDPTYAYPNAELNGIETLNKSDIYFEINVPEAGFYNIEMQYHALAARGVDIERCVYINGEIPFDGADSVAFTRMWTDAGEPRTDNQGNQIHPTQIESFGSQTAFFKDAMGYEREPYRFYFSEGAHTLRIHAASEPIVIQSLTLKAPKSAKTYAEYIESAPKIEETEAARKYSTTLQGEDAYLRSSPSLYAKYDRSSSATEPYDVYHTVLNMTGGEAWRSPGQWIEWKFSVPEDGYYNITLKARQNFARGVLSCRALYIDGEIPFKEMQEIAFEYDNEWNTVTLADKNGEKYRFFLKSGEHTLRLEATLGGMGDVLSDMSEHIYTLNAIYRKILVLTGATPDKYRDYKLHEVYPEYIKAMDVESRLLYKLVDDAVAVTGQKSDRTAVAQTLAVQLEEFYENPDQITKVFTNFKDNITALGTSMQEMSIIRLSIDKIVITGTDASAQSPTENAFTNLAHEVRSCIASYSVDYNALGDVYTGDDEDEAIEVWILTGRDQSTILKSMVDDSFTPQTGIKVNVMLVDPNALLNAVVAGNGPDVVVSTDSWNPVNYALRHAAEDVLQFEDAETVLEAFYPSAYRAFQFEGGLYALPETQLCSVLYYRKDILDEYELNIPKKNGEYDWESFTWDDFIGLLPTIQGANMAVGVPFPDIKAPDLATYYAMLYQNGGTIYNERGTQTTVSNEAGIKAFEMYTSLHKDYGLPVIFDFISRFRTGEMPMGIFDYTIFNTLAVSAPEIRGLWDIAMIPGTRRINENGEEYIDHSGHSQGTCCMMIATDDEQIKKNSWEFMKWWVSTESQVRFGREIESILGSSARYATANRAAIEQIAWSESQLDVIRSQMKWAVGFREVAGGYYTNRHLTNAVRKVYNEKTDQRETLTDYSRVINEEIQKKRAEFGLPPE